MTNDPRAVKSLKAYYKNTPLDITKMVESADKETDRASVIILAAQVEDILLHAIATKFTGLRPARDSAHIFQYDGALGAFSARIEMARALGVISAATKDQLNMLREMRNACAHSIKPISFETPELRAVVRRFAHNVDLADEALLARAYRSATVLTACEICRDLSAIALKRGKMVLAIIEKAEANRVANSSPSPSPSPDRSQSQSNPKDHPRRTKQAPPSRPEPSQASRPKRPGKRARDRARSETSS